MGVFEGDNAGSSSGELVVQRQARGSFHGLVPPAEGPLGRDPQVPQLAYGHLSGDLGFDQLADALFPDATRSCHEKEHFRGRLTEGSVGGNEDPQTTNLTCAFVQRRNSPNPGSVEGVGQCFDQIVFGRGYMDPVCPRGDANPLSCLILLYDPNPISLYFFHRLQKTLPKSAL